MTISHGVRLVLAILWFLFISFLFFLPQNDIPKEGWLDKIPFIDKLVHVGFFCVLTGLWIWAFPRKALVYRIVGAAVLYGLLVEIIQLLFIPSRSFDLFDWAADSIGVLVGYLFWYLYIKK